MSKTQGENKHNYGGSTGDESRRPVPRHCRELGTGEDLREKWVNRPEAYRELTLEIKARVGDWIIAHASSTQGENSYGLKHWLQEDTGIYVTNGQFIGAMLEASFERADPDELNPRFRLARKDEKGRR